jgi:hypothetical protein
MLGSKTIDPVDRATLVTRKVAPTGLAEYAFGSSVLRGPDAARTR